MGRAAEEQKDTINAKAGGTGTGGKTECWYHQRCIEDY